MHKISEKWIDEETGIKADISPNRITIIPGSITIYAQKNNTTGSFTFRNSDRVTVDKVIKSLSKLNSIHLDETVWKATETFVTEIDKFKHEHPESAVAKVAAKPILQKLHKRQGGNVRRKNNF